MNAPVKHFLDLSEIPAKELRRMIEFARTFKKSRRSLSAKKPLEGRTLAMVFDKPSTRTRVSFYVAMRELGGNVITLTGEEMQLGRGETVADTARVLSRYVDLIMIRTLDHTMVAELARHATVPVINGLTKLSHPCQVMADVFTFEEKKGSIRGRTVAWSGDANNVLASWVHAAARFDFGLKVATPKEHGPRPALRDWARQSGAAISFLRDPEEAVAGADCIVTDTWVSMGDRDGKKRHNVFKPYQVNGALMKLAKRDAIFMHCLPAHRGAEVTDSVMDSDRSIVFDQSQNRLHVQKAILLTLLN
jgi:ornithine carbamoyltransferase